MEEKFSVYQFFPDDTNERVRQLVSMDDAVAAFKHYTNSVGARFGTTVRVIMTDGADEIVAEWKYGEGIVFPPREVRDDD